MPFHQRRHAREFLSHDVGKRNRPVVGVALREVDQDGGDDGVMLREVGAGQHIGLVLQRRELGGLLVGRLLRQCVDRGTTLLAETKAVGVDRDEDLAAEPARVGDPIAQADELVAIARQYDAVAPAALDQCAQLAGHLEDEILLVEAVHRCGAGIHTAMPWVEHHHRPFACPAGGSG